MNPIQNPAGLFDSYSLHSRSLAGPLESRLDALSSAGFGGLMLDAHDVVAHPQGADGVAQALRARGLRADALGTLHDFEGLDGAQHRHKIEVAKGLLETCARLGAPVLVVAASTAPQAGTERSALVRDLHKLAMLAVPLGLRVAYQAVSWARTAPGFIDAWDLVCEADCSNLGLCLDAFHILAGQNPLEDLIEVEPERLFQVRLSDFLWDTLPAPEGQGSHDARVFPGQGAHSEQLADLVMRLARLGWRGHYCLDAPNADHAQLPAAFVMAQARRSAQWLDEDVLHRAAPLPDWTRGDPAAR